MGKETENKDIGVRFVKRIMGEILVEKSTIKIYIIVFALKIEHTNNYDINIMQRQKLSKNGWIKLYLKKRHP